MSMVQSMDATQRTGACKIHGAPMLRGTRVMPLSLNLSGSSYPLHVTFINGSLIFKKCKESEMLLIHYPLLMRQVEGPSLEVHGGGCSQAPRV